jgi:hypothetical protein
MRTDFAIGQRVASLPGLHWMPVQRAGTVLDINPVLVIVLLDPTSRWPRGERKAFTRKNIIPVEG